MGDRSQALVEITEDEKLRTCEDVNLASLERSTSQLPIFSTSIFSPIARFLICAFVADRQGVFLNRVSFQYMFLEYFTHLLFIQGAVFHRRVIHNLHCCHRLFAA